MKEMDFAELESVSGGIKLGGLANNAVTTTPAIDPFTQQPLGGVPFDPFHIGIGAPVQYSPYGFANNNGCNPNPCNPCSPCDNGGYVNILNGGQLGNPLGGFLNNGLPNGGLVTAGTQPIVDPSLAGQIGALGQGPLGFPIGGAPFGGLVGGLPFGPQGTISINGVPVGSPLGSPVGSPFGTLGSPIGAPVSPAIPANGSPLGFVF